MKRYFRSISDSEASFVWAVPKDGPVAFAAHAADGARARKQGRGAARGAGARAETVDEIPPFDLALAHELYRVLLEAGGGGLEAGQAA